MKKTKNRLEKLEYNFGYSMGLLIITGTIMGYILGLISLSQFKPIPKLTLEILILFSFYFIFLLEGKYLKKKYEKLKKEILKEEVKNEK